MKKYLAAVLFLFLLASAMPVHATWYNESWRMKTNITITGSVANNSVIKVSLDSSFSFNYTLDNGADIRVLNSTETGTMNFFIETWNKTENTGIIFINLSRECTDYDPCTIWLYYFNASVATTTSDYSHVFDYFLTDSTNLTGVWGRGTVKYTTNYTYGILGTQTIYLAKDDDMAKSTNQTIGVAEFVFRHYYAAVDKTVFIGLTSNAATGADELLLGTHPNIGTSNYSCYNGATVTSSGIAQVPTTGIIKFRFKHNGTTIFAYINDTNVINKTSPTVAGIVGLKLYHDDYQNPYIDSIKVWREGVTAPTLAVGVNQNYSAGVIAPTATFGSPADLYTMISNNDVTFNCSASDTDGNVSSITLYTNITGTWTQTDNMSANSSYASGQWAETITSSGKYAWNCYAVDDGGLSAWAGANRTFTAMDGYINVTAYDENTETIFTDFNMTITYPSGTVYNYTTNTSSAVISVIEVGTSIIKVTHSGYYAREYSVLILNSTINYIRAYLISTTEGKQVIILVKSDQGVPLQGAFVNVTKSISGAYLTIGSMESAAGGIASFYLDEDTTYMVYVSLSGYDSTQASLRPLESAYTFTLNTSITVVYNNVWDGITYLISPAGNYLPKAEIMDLIYSIECVDSTLIWTDFNVTWNGTTQLYYINSTGSSGATLNHTRNISSMVGNVTVYVRFQRTGYSMVTIIKVYEITTVSAQGYTFYDLINAVKSGNYGLDKSTGGILTILLIMMTMSSLGLSIAGFRGASILALLLLGLVVMIGSFSWVFFVLIALTTISLLFIMGR